MYQHALPVELLLTIDGRPDRLGSCLDTSRDLDPSGSSSDVLEFEIFRPFSSDEAGPVRLRSVQHFQQNKKKRKNDPTNLIKSILLLRLFRVPRKRQSQS